jgi:hypothetical protein
MEKELIINNEEIKVGDWIENEGRTDQVIEILENESFPYKTFDGFEFSRGGSKKVDPTYAQLWKVTIPTEFPRQGNEPIQYIYGTRGLTKMLDFARTNTLTNELIDELMAIDPLGEGEDRKLTSRFQRALLKYRAHIYRYPEFSTKQLKRKKRNANTAKQNQPA